MALNFDSIGTMSGPVSCEYDEDDVILYALGIGVEPDELQFLYEKGLKVLPTFAAVAARRSGLNPFKVLNADMKKVVHGENRIEVYRALPPRAKSNVTSTIKAIHDKGKGALAVIELEARDEAGEPIYRNISSAFIRGEGGFGGDRGPSGSKNAPPDRKPDKVVSLTTQKNQAQIYRLSGDKNPLHVDPDFAKLAGFDRPILHGLCTFGYVGRSVLRAYCDNEPARLKALEVRFSAVVFPGDTLAIEMWHVSDDKIILQTKVGDRVVVSNAAAEIV